MADPFVAEIRIFPFNFAPKGWAWCDGQLLPLSQNTALFSLLGTTYGGDGRTTFGLPDMRGRAPVHVGAGFELGQKGGETTHTLALGEMPQHTHAFRGATNASTADTPDQTRKLVEKMTEKLRNEFDSRSSVVRAAMYDALQNAMDQPRPISAEAKAAFDARIAAWKAKNAKLSANLKDATMERDKAKDAFDKAVGDSLAKEADARKWSEAQTKTFDECFPDYAKLRKEGVGRMPKAACPSGSGLGGIIENEACQIGR
jgi:microcystin-dependent protein